MEKKLTRTQLDAQDKQVHENYEWFMTQLPDLLQTRRGETALIKDKTILAFFETHWDAHVAGQLIFKNKPFSTQTVTDQGAHCYGCETS